MVDSLWLALDVVVLDQIDTLDKHFSFGLCVLNSILMSDDQTGRIDLPTDQIHDETR